MLHSRLVENRGDQGDRGDQGKMRRRGNLGPRCVFWVLWSDDHQPVGLAGHTDCDPDQPGSINLITASAVSIIDEQQRSTSTAGVRCADSERTFGQHRRRVRRAKCRTQLAAVPGTNITSALAVDCCLPSPRRLGDRDGGLGVLESSLLLLRMLACRRQGEREKGHGGKTGKKGQEESMWRTDHAEWSTRGTRGRGEHADRTKPTAPRSAQLFICSVSPYSP